MYQKYICEYWVGWDIYHLYKISRLKVFFELYISIQTSHADSRLSPINWPGRNFWASKLINNILRIFNKDNVMQI